MARANLNAFLLIALTIPAWGIEIEKVVWEKPVVTAVPGEADELKSLLADEVGKMVKAGHLLPYFTRRGELNTIWCFTNPGQTVRALARAYPYLPVALQSEVRSYLAKEMSAYPPWSDKLNAPTDVGTPRQLHGLPSRDMEWDPGRYARQPRLQNLYAVWLYADLTGDSVLVKDHWTELKVFYRQHERDVECCFGGMSAPIAMSRMAHAQGKADEARAFAEAAGKALQAAVKEPDMRQPMLARYGFEDKWYVPYHYAGYQFLDLSPEVARYVRETPDVKRLVVEQTAEGTHQLPMWFVSQASCFMRCYGESHAITPYVSAMIFPVKAWVERVPAARLRDWVSAEDAPRGDLFYIERLVTAIEGYGKVDWVDVRK